MTDSHVDRVVAARIAAARQKAEARKRAREELAAARRRGLAQRHAQKLRNLQAQDRPTGNVSTQDAEQLPQTPAKSADRSEP
ncbi:hypothetical protein [Streptomyces lavendulae]|uniref:hypothetical protein n=1 Tax=Streptomyces lavendulae TaxID=1914 RepID=UPI0036EF368B